MIKNDFYLMLKALFVVEVIKLLPDFFFFFKNGLIKRLTQQQISTIHILPNISRSKGNQTIKLCQFIEYKMRNILEKSYGKRGEETSPKPIKNIKIEHVCGSTV